jgi:hypothetical protein
VLVEYFGHLIARLAFSLLLKFAFEVEESESESRENVRAACSDKSEWG